MKNEDVPKPEFDRQGLDTSSFYDIRVRRLFS